MISRSILTKNNLFIAPLVLLLAIHSSLCKNPHSQIIKNRSGSLQIALKVNFDEVDINLLEIENFTIQLKGRHFQRTQKIGKEFLLWLDVPENLYEIKLRNSKSELEFSGNFSVKKGQKTDLEIHWVGNDHRNLLNPRIWILKIAGGWGQGIRWDYGSWHQTFHADGKVEIHHQGIAFGRDSEKKIYSRFDWDNDLISDLEDRDDDNDGVYDENDRDNDNDGTNNLEDNHDTDNDNDGVINELEVRDQILGNLQYPIIESYSVINLGSRIEGFQSDLGDLIKIDFKISEAGGKVIDKVNCQVFSRGKLNFSFEPLDDGSIEDLESDLLGRQISGDLISGDNIYSITIPIDVPAWRALYPSTVACKAVNVIGKESQEILLFPGESKDQALPVSKSKLYDQIDDLGVKFFKTKLENRIKEVKLDLQLKKPMRVKVYLGERFKFLEPTKKTLKFTSYSDNLIIPQSGLFFLTILGDDGGVFYLGEKVN